MEKYHVSRGPISVTILHAAERIYTRGSVAFCSFLSGPKIENYINGNPKSFQTSRFFSRSREKVKKRDTRIQMARKWITFLRLNFIFIFQEIQLT